LTEDLTREQAVELTARWVLAARHAVAFTGAGLSTDSGIPDFRGPDGVWTRRDAGLPPRRKVPRDQIKPNACHLALVELQRLRKLRFVSTQNTDDSELDAESRELDRQLEGTAAHRDLLERLSADLIAGAARCRRRRPCWPTSAGSTSRRGCVGSGGPTPAAPRKPPWRPPWSTSPCSGSRTATPGTKRRPAGWPPTTGAVTASR
jgi:hypothetical protein